MDCMTWRFRTMKQSIGCSTSAPRSSAAKQWFEQLAQKKKKILLLLSNNKNQLPLFPNAFQGTKTSDLINLSTFYCGIHMCASLHCTKTSSKQCVTVDPFKQRFTLKLNCVTHPCPMFQIALFVMKNKFGLFRFILSCSFFSSLSILFCWKCLPIADIIKSLHS